MEEAYRFKYLSEESLNKFKRETPVIVLLDELIERRAQRLKHQA